MSKTHRDLHDWLFAVPLVHFLIQECAPFDSSVLLMEKPKKKDDAWWGANGFETKAVRERSFTGDRYFHPFLSKSNVFVRLADER